MNYFENNRVYMNTQDNALQIAGPKSLDSGSYTCVASNGIDSDSASATLRVQVCFIICSETSPTKQMSAALQAFSHYASRKKFCLSIVVIFGTSIKIPLRPTCNDCSSANKKMRAGLWKYIAYIMKT